MVIKTDTCAFSEQKIYPGRGVTFIRRDGRKFQFLDPKMRHLFLGDRKPLKCRWNKQWRRANKKETILRQVKKEKRRTIRQDRGIEGLTLQDLLQKKNANAEQRKAERNKKAAEVKGKNKNKKTSIKQRLKELRQRQEAKDGKDTTVTTGKAGKGGKGKGKGQQKGKGGKAKGGAKDAQSGKGGKGKGKGKGKK